MDDTMVAMICIAVLAGISSFLTIEAVTLTAAISAIAGLAGKKVMGSGMSLFNKGAEQCQSTITSSTPTE